MDNPLFGDENSKKNKIIFWTVVVIVGFIILFTSGVLIVYGILTKWWMHFVFIGLILSILIPEFIFLYWQKYTYLEPKMKIIMVILVLICLFACALALMYVWGLRYPGEGCTDQNLFRRADNKCFKPIECMEQPNRCVVWRKSGDEWTPSCGSFNSTTHLCYA